MNPVAVIAVDPANRRRKLVHAFDLDADESLCEYAAGDDVTGMYRAGGHPIPFADLDLDTVAHRICGPCQRIHRIRWPHA